MMKKQSKHLNMQKHWEETESFAWKELQVENKNYTYCYMNLYVWSHLETLQSIAESISRVFLEWHRNSFTLYFIVSFFQVITDILIIAHGKWVSYFLIKSRKSYMLKNPKESMAAEIILEVPKLLELFCVFGEVKICILSKWPL